MPGPRCAQCGKPLIIKPAGVTSSASAQNKPVSPAPAPSKPAAKPPSFVPPAAQPAQLAASADELIASLRKLGIELSKRHLVGFAVAVVAGLVVARILPLVWGYFDPLLRLFGSARDDMNILMMTVITFLVSGFVAFSYFKKP